MITLHINDRLHELDVDPDTPLLWVLREHLHLTGTKYSCGIGQCGACTVLLDGVATTSCTMPAGDARHCRITTIEGLQGPVADRLRQAWLDENVVQCGYCQPGQILTATELLRHTPHPDDAAISRAMSTVLCRCGTYQGIARAIRKAAGELSHDQS